MKRYVDQKNRCAEMVLLKQKVYYTKIISDAGNCQKTLFKIANERLDKVKQKILPSYTEPKKLANDFNSFYVQKVQKIRQSIPENTVTQPYCSRPFTGE